MKSGKLEMQTRRKMADSDPHLHPISLGNRRKNGRVSVAEKLGYTRRKPGHCSLTRSVRVGSCSLHAKEHETTLPCVPPSVGSLLLRRPHHQETRNPQDPRQGRSLSHRRRPQRERRSSRIQPPPCAGCTGRRATPPGPPGRGSTSWMKSPS